MAVTIIGKGALARIVANILYLKLEEEYKMVESNEFEPVKDAKVIIAIGDIETRKRLYEEYKKAGCIFHTAIHPITVVPSSAVIGQGCIIKDNVTIEVDAIIGPNSIIGNGSVICHDVVIGSHCRIAPGVIIAGHSIIDDECYLALKVSIDRNLVVGKQSTIASGCTIWKDVPKNSIVKLPQKMDVKERE